MGQTILHVEDDPDIGMIIKLLFEKRGFKVFSVMNGEAALQMMKKEKIDLMLLDIMLPDMSGWDLYTKIRKVNKDVKVAFLSVIPVSKERIKDLQEHGVSDYITKPFDKNDLIARIEKIVHPIA
jgi:DNA-binding response OmpR family regulator